MPIGPGKYDDLCTHVREKAKAEGAAVIIFNGSEGSGFSVQASMRFHLVISVVLEAMACDIRKGLGQPKALPPEMLFLMGAVQTCLEARSTCDLPESMAKPMHALAEIYDKLSAEFNDHTACCS